MSEHTCPVMNSLLIPTVTVALALALETTQDCDDVIRAAALRKDLLLAEANPANPYGSAKHGEFDAPSAAAVAEDVPGWDDPLPGDPHLPESKGGQDGCTHPGCHDHMPAPTREADAAELAAHAPRGAQ